MAQRYDIVIIGSGAGGAPVADRVAALAPNKRILVVEKGPGLRTQEDDPNGTSDFKRDELFATGPAKRVAVPGVANVGASYWHSHVEPDINDEPHVYRDSSGRDKATIEGYTAQVVGGGTQLYGGVSLRFSELDFRLGSFNQRRPLKADPNGDVARWARDWPMTYAELAPWYAMAEEFVGISGTVAGQAKDFQGGDWYQKPTTPNPISETARLGMTRLGFTTYRTPIAVITQDHDRSSRRAADPKTGFVNRFGDPLGLKSNTWVSLLRPLVRRGAIELRTNCTAMQLLATNSRIDRVVLRNEVGETEVIEAGIVVVACSAIESIRLVKLSAAADAALDGRIHPSGPSGRKDLLGRYFLTHAFGGAETSLPDRHDKSLSVDSDYATDDLGRSAFLDEHGLWAGGAVYNNTSSHALPLSLAATYGAADMDSIWSAFASASHLTGERLVSDLLDRNFGRQLSVSFMANQVPNPDNRIELHPTVTDKWGRPAAMIIKTWHSHDVHLMEVLAGVCRDILRFGLDPAGNAPIDGFGGVYLGEHALARIANHILGGMRMGTDPHDSVLDPMCRYWELDNLYVTDGAWMPTSGSANPTLTIQANAFRVGTYLAEKVL